MYYSKANRQRREIASHLSCERRPSEQLTYMEDTRFYLVGGTQIVLRYVTPDFDEIVGKLAE
jgi:hypothetical protein